MKLSQLPAIGTPMQGGHYGGAVCVGELLFAVIWAPKATGETKGAWLPRYEAVPGSESCSDSLTNTLAMAEAGSALAKWALALRIDGYDDWCLPARDVLELAYRQLKPTTDETGNYFRDGDNPSSAPVGYPYANTNGGVVQTPVVAFQEGNAEAFTASWYWSSTQYSAGNAWVQYFSHGGQFNNGKKYEARARAVRLIQLDA
jgi:hypothetical protein